jgi:hypothetical protein
LSTTNFRFCEGLGFVVQLAVNSSHFFIGVAAPADLVKLININQIPDKTDTEQRSVTNSVRFVAIIFYQSIVAVDRVLSRIVG